MKIPVLYYHKIDNPRDEAVYKGLYVTPEQFGRQMAILKLLGYQTVGPDDVAGFIRGHKLNASKPILITFDDGYKNNYTNAFPILQKYGFKALIFVSSGFIGKKNTALDERETAKEDFLDKKDIKEMYDKGFFIGSHGINHYFMDRLEEGVLVGELIASKAYLENMLETKIDYFSYPFGSYNEGVVRAVKNAGYAAAFTTKKGKVGVGDNSFTLKRISVNGFNNIFTFLYKIIFLQ